MDLNSTSPSALRMGEVKGRQDRSDRAGERSEAPEVGVLKRLAEVLSERLVEALVLILRDVGGVAGPNHVGWRNYLNRLSEQL